MHRVIVIQFVTLDGVVEDPDGSGGTLTGGWSYRYGRAALAGDKFNLGPILDNGVLLFGRGTWEVFAGRWPTRTDDFAAAMNRIPKLVASRSLSDVGAWNNSSLITGDLFAAVEKERRARDVVVVGSTSIVHGLADRDLVDEYRLLVFPSVIGGGARLFREGAAPVHLKLVSAEAAGPTVLLCYERSSS